MHVHVHVHCAILLINLAGGCVKHYTPATLQNHYKDVIEHRQQSMTEQALGERRRMKECGGGGESKFGKEMTVRASERPKTKRE